MSLPTILVDDGDCDDYGINGSIAVSNEPTPSDKQSDEKTDKLESVCKDDAAEDANGEAKKISNDDYVDMVDQDNCNEGGDNDKDIGGEAEPGDSSRSHTTRESKNDRDEGRSDERSNRKSLSDDDDEDDDDSDD